MTYKALKDKKNYLLNKLKKKIRAFYRTFLIFLLYDKNCYTP